MKLLALISIIFLDQSSKLLINKFVLENESFTILPFLNIVNFHNTGISFGLFKNIIPQYLLLIIILSIIIILFIWFIKTNLSTEKWGILMIISGATGNLIDRIFHGYVVDFIFLNYKDYYWPAFNIADMAISLGVIIIIFTTFAGNKFNVKAKHE